MHPFRACPYLIEQIRTSDWVLDPAVRRKIDSTLSKFDTLREAVERAQHRANGTIKSHTVSIASRDKSTAREQKREEIETCTPRTMQTHSPTYSFIRGTFTSARSDNLKDSWTLSSVTDTHICNDHSRFKFERKASPGDFIHTGIAEHQIEAFGSVAVPVNTSSGKITMTLLNVALVPGYLTNLVVRRKSKIAPSP